MFLHIRLRATLHCIGTVIAILVLTGGYQSFAQNKDPVSDKFLRKIAILDFFNIENNPDIRYLEPSITAMVRKDLEGRYSFRSLPEVEFNRGDVNAANSDGKAGFEWALAAGSSVSADFVVTGSFVTRQTGSETVVVIRFLIVDIKEKSIVHEFTAESAVDYRLWGTIDKSTAVIAEALELYQPRPAISGRTYYDGHTLYVNGGVRFRFEKRDDIAVDRVMYRIDGDDEKSSAGEIAPGAEGPHLIRYYAVDKAENREPDKYFHYVADLSSPMVTVRSSEPVISHEGKNYISGRAVIRISADDALSGTGTILYSLNGKDYIPYVSGIVVPSESGMNLRVTAEDKVGNRADIFSFVRKAGDIDKTGAMAINIDSSSPSVRIVPGSPVAVLEGKKVSPRGAMFTVEGEDSGSGISTFLVRVDGKGDFVPYEGALVFNTPGNHFIEARAVDRTGNESAVVTESFIVDPIPPKTAIERKD
ncbi:MAG TPA: hypothetical protein PKK43_12885 [Spirochaetota bacterium]|nr:hypothetical protein [Spirochaetota bacterium]